MSEEAPYFAWYHSLSVEGVRTFAASQTLLLHRDGVPARWTILLGDNGTGKSTLLHMLADLRPTEIGRDPEGLGPYAVPVNAKGRWRPSLRSTEHTTSVPSVCLEVACAHVRTGPVVHNVWMNEEYNPNDASISSGVSPGTSLPPFSQLSSVVIAYGPFRRLRRGAALGSNGSLGPSVESLFDADAPLVPAEEWLLQRDYAVARSREGTPERARAQQSFDRVKALLLSLLPDVTDLEVVIPDPSVGGAELHAHTHYGRVRVSELGQGYQSTLAWVVDLAARMAATYSYSDDPLSEPAVVLVDEIDLHLHPRWQRMLLEQLSERFPNVQWIVTAHSPLVVQNAPADANIAVLRREGDHVVIDNNHDRVRSWRLDQILTSDLFGLPSARASALDEPIARRDALLAKGSLSADEERELAAIDDKLDALPEGEGLIETEVLKILKDAAAAEAKR